METQITITKQELLQWCEEGKTTWDYMEKLQISSSHVLQKQLQTMIKDDEVFEKVWDTLKENNRKQKKIAHFSLTELKQKLTEHMTTIELMRLYGIISNWNLLRAIKHDIYQEPYQQEVADQYIEEIWQFLKRNDLRHRQQLLYEVIFEEDCYIKQYKKLNQTISPNLKIDPFATTLLETSTGNKECYLYEYYYLIQFVQQEVWEDTTIDKYIITPTLKLLTTRRAKTEESKKQSNFINILNKIKANPTFHIIPLSSNYMYQGPKTRNINYKRSEADLLCFFYFTLKEKYEKVTVFSDDIHLLYSAYFLDINIQYPTQRIIPPSKDERYKNLTYEEDIVLVYDTCSILNRGIWEIYEIKNTILLFTNIIDEIFNYCLTHQTSHIFTTLMHFAFHYPNIKVIPTYSSEKQIFYQDILLLQNIKKYATQYPHILLKTVDYKMQTEAVLLGIDVQIEERPVHDIIY